jgi:hypothetical protein
VRAQAGGRSAHAVPKDSDLPTVGPRCPDGREAGTIGGQVVGAGQLSPGRSGEHETDHGVRAALLLEHPSDSIELNASGAHIVIDDDRLALSAARIGHPQDARQGVGGLDLGGSAIAG